MPMFSDPIRGLAAALICAAIAVSALALGRDILMPLALATVLAFILAPIVRYLAERRVPRGVAVALVVISMMAILIAGAVVFSAQLLSLTASLAGYKDNLVQKVRMVSGGGSRDNALSKAAASVDTLGKELQKEAAGSATPATSNQSIVVTRESAGSGSTVIDQAAGLLRPLALSGLTVLFTLFLLAQHHDIRDRVVRLAGIDNMPDTTSALDEAGTRLSRLFLMQAALNASFGALVGISLAIIGVPNAALWGVATCLLRFVPFVGSILSAVPPLLLAAAVDPGWGMVIATLSLFLIGETLLGHVIEPLVLGRGIGLSSLAMVAAASFWTLVWGPVGLVLAAPLTMCIVVLGQYIPRLEFMSVALGDAPALAPEHEFYHRLLSADPVAAAEQFDVAATQDTMSAAADLIALPALRIAARDLRIDRLDLQQVTAIRDTMESVIELTIGASIPAVAVRGAHADHGQRILVVPAHGPIDAAAAKLVAAIITAATLYQCDVVQQSSGLMALSSAREAVGAGPVAAVMLSTVGGLDQKHLRLLERRARRDFPGCRLLMCDWAAPSAPTASRPSVEASQSATIASLTSAIGLLGLDHRVDATPPATDETQTAA